MPRAYSLVIALCVTMCALGQPRAKTFHRGHIYVSEIWVEGCWVGAPQFIREIDPATGDSWVFADMSDDICDPAGLVFTPDWGLLRVANSTTDEVFDFDPAANHSIKYGPRDGLVAPGDNNGMAFNAAGDFFITNPLSSSGRLLKFPGDMAPGALFAQQLWTGTIAFHPDGRLFFCSSSGLVIYTLDAQGQKSTFEQLSPSYRFKTIAIASNGDLYAGIEFGDSHGTIDNTIYKYDNSVPQTKHAVAQFGLLSDEFTLALSADQRELYLCQSFLASIFGIDLQTGEIRTVFEFPEQFIVSVGSGMAVYAPPLPAGDVNCDGTVNQFDIDPFILVLSDDTAYSRKFPGCDIELADTNADGSINQFDIQGFVERLTP